MPHRRVFVLSACLIVAVDLSTHGQPRSGGSLDPPTRESLAGESNRLRQGYGGPPKVYAKAEDSPLRRVQSHGEPEPGARSSRNASYDIDVTLDPTSHMLRGRETIRWRNISAASTSELQFHLYWNAWRNGDSTWMRERRTTAAYTPPLDDSWGWTDVSALRLRDPSGAIKDVTSQFRFIAPDDGNARDRTVISVPLGMSVGPNATVQVEVEWTAKVPRPFARTGYVGNYYFIGQWFPKLGVLEDSGWNTHQFHSATEFYSDFGVYDVRITAPSAFVVGASGIETQNSQLKTQKNSQPGETTHSYHGEDIHDFAWTASPNFIDLSRTFTHETLPKVDMRLLMQPERRSQANRYFSIVAAALTRYGEWFGAYPYGHVTIVDPAFLSLSDGMEYPTLFTGRSNWLVRPDTQRPEGTTAHEAGHQWWYGMVASNEFEHAWMDEGINTYATARVLDEAFRPNHVEARYFGGFVPWSFTDIPFSRLENDRITGYRDNAEADVQSTPTFRYWPGTATNITYNKTALWLHTLENHLGWPIMQRILRTYFDRWKFRHPTPDDFFQVADEVSGQDLMWFFDQVYRSSNTFDYGIQDLRSEKRDDGSSRTMVVVRRYGEATFPVDVVTTFADGQQITERWNGLDRRVIYTYDRGARATSVQVDPKRVLLLDTNFTNNSRTVEPRASEASLKWAAKWMVWLEDLMLTYAFFV